VDHARRCGGRTARKIAAIDYQRIESVQRQFSEDRGAVNARSDNQDRDVGVLAELGDSLFSIIGQCADGFDPFGGRASDTRGIPYKESPRRSIWFSDRRRADASKLLV
jgi:hypothetical protein